MADTLAQVMADLRRSSEAALAVAEVRLAALLTPTPPPAPDPPGPPGTGLPAPGTLPKRTGEVLVPPRGQLAAVEVVHPGIRNRNSAINTKDGGTVRGCVVDGRDGGQGLFGNNTSIRDTVFRNVAGGFPDAGASDGVWNAHGIYDRGEGEWDNLLLEESPRLDGSYIVHCYGSANSPRLNKVVRRVHDTTSSPWHLGGPQIINWDADDIDKRQGVVYVGGYGGAHGNALLGGIWPHLVIRGTWRSFKFRPGCRAQKITRESGAQASTANVDTSNLTIGS